MRGGLGLLLALGAFEAAADEFDLGGEATGGAVEVAAGAGLVEGSAGFREALLFRDHAAGHAAACSVGAVAVAR